MIDTFCTYSLCDFSSGSILEEGDYVDCIKFSNVDGKDCVISYAIIENITHDDVIVSTDFDFKEFTIAVKDIIDWEK